MLTAALIHALALVLTLAVAGGAAHASIGTAEAVVCCDARASEASQPSQRPHRRARALAVAVVLQRSTLAPRTVEACQGLAALPPPLA